MKDIIMFRNLNAAYFPVELAKKIFQLVVE